jgi:arylsulfatase A
MVHFCDWLPTLCSLTGVDASRGLPVDGRDVGRRLRGDSDALPDVRFWQRNRYEPLPRCNGAMRDGPWKLVWPMRSGADRKDPADGAPYREGLTSPHRLMPVDASLPERTVGPPGEAQLYYLDRDPEETCDLAAQHPERVESMAREWDRWFGAMREAWERAYRDNVGLDQAG